MFFLNNNYSPLKNYKMKKLILLCLASLVISAAYTQTQLNPFLKNEVTSPKVFLGFSTGIDNMIGILGPQVEFVVVDKLIVGGGIGLSSWGTKWAVNLQFYPNGWHKFYLKTGYSKNSGLDEFETELELSSGNTEMVMMDLKPIGNLFFTAGYAWKMGKRNKFYLEGGYALPLVTEDYYVLYDENVQLSETSKQALQMLRPGGLVIALGFNFAIASTKTNK
jgi:hypothetical protein